MEAQEYIIKELESFIKRFTKVRVRYEYDERAVVHTIEVLPNEVYHLDEEYISWERQMFEDFIERYPDENIGFITGDALVGVENPLYIKEGLDYSIFSRNEGIISFEYNLIFIEQAVTKEMDNPTISSTEVVDNRIKETLTVPDYCQKFPLAA